MVLISRPFPDNGSASSKDQKRCPQNTSTLIHALTTATHHSKGTAVASTRDTLTNVKHYFSSYCLMIESYPTLIVASIEILLSDFLISALKAIC